MKHPVPKSIADCIYQGAAAGTKGGTTDTRKSIGHLKLTYAAKRMFGISRLPTHPERFADTMDMPYRDMAAGLEAMSISDWNSFIDDLQTLYKNVQEELAKDYPDGYVTLRRRLRLIPQGEDDYRYGMRGEEISYGEHVTITMIKAQAEGLSELDFDADILTGWCLNDPCA